VCGIFGIIARNARVPPDLLERGTLSLAHRGPDDSGTVIFHDEGDEAIEIGLGNRRLSILDLSPLGHQPMSDPATGNRIVYNGELYNFRELRTRLEAQSVRFNSASDTEVILKAYGHWGEACLQHFRGIFAFAIWDARRHHLFLARDPMGVKPLYYFQSESYFVFSSEVRAILQTGLVPRSIDSAGLISYLTFGSLYDPFTLVRDVSSLLPGQSLTWKHGTLTHNSYWDLAEAAQSTSPSASPKHRTDLESQISEMLDSSVRMQLVSDVPVGVFLSGGIDSSSLVAILSRNGIRPNTFSIVFREQDYSEAEFSRTIAQHFGADHHEITVTQSDLLSTIPAALAAMDLPTIDGINTYFVSQHARAAGIKVALSGLGGDETFAGYASFRAVPRMEKFAAASCILPSAIRTSVASILVALAPTTDQSRKLATLVSDNDVFAHPYFLSRMLFMPHQTLKLLPGQVSDDEAFHRTTNSLDACRRHAQDLDPINRVSYLESRCYMLNTLLRDADAMSMAHGLEVRVPLIDHQLAARVLALPGAWKLDDKLPKPLLLKSLRHPLPEKIVNRRKRGFTLPFEHWLHDELRTDVEQTLQRIGSGPLGDMISVPAVLSVWDDFLVRRTSWTRPWSLFVLERWCERHLSN
jgi:asparagine synthase (glutamine-hydrolysing)